MRTYPKRPARRTRHIVTRLTAPERAYPARRHVVMPDPPTPLFVEVRIARNRRHMREDIRRMEGAAARPEPELMGMVRSYHDRITGRPRIRPRGVVARMYLNRADLRKRPSEIVSHECTHAGMAWARLKGARLSRMAGEEVLCYAVGKMVAQVNTICYAERVWP